MEMTGVEGWKEKRLRQMRDAEDKKKKAEREVVSRSNWKSKNKDHFRVHEEMEECQKILNTHTRNIKAGK